MADAQARRLTGSQSQRLPPACRTELRLTERGHLCRGFLHSPLLAWAAHRGRSHPEWIFPTHSSLGKPVTDTQKDRASQSHQRSRLTGRKPSSHKINPTGRAKLPISVGRKHWTTVARAEEGQVPKTAERTTKARKGPQPQQRC